MSDDQIKDIFKNSKTIAMVGVSSEKKGEDPKNLKRKPANVVMKYMQDFGYKVIPVNPFAKGETINGEGVIITDGRVRIRHSPCPIRIEESSEFSSPLSGKDPTLGSAVLSTGYGEFEECSIVRFFHDRGVLALTSICLLEDYIDEVEI